MMLALVSVGCVSAPYEYGIKKMSQDFWIGVEHTDLHPLGTVLLSGVCFKITVPNNCIYCQHPITIISRGSAISPTYIDTACDHIMTYEQIYYMRVHDQKLDGVNSGLPLQEAPCKQCGRMNDLGIKKCWWCEIGLNV